MLDVAAAAREFGWPSAAALRKDIERGRVPFRRRGRRIVLLRDELDALLRELPGLTLDAVRVNGKAKE